jgi:hypothetical protein
MDQLVIETALTIFPLSQESLEPLGRFHGAQPILRENSPPKLSRILTYTSKRQPPRVSLKALVIHHPRTIRPTHNYSFDPRANDARCFKLRPAKFSPGVVMFRDL